MDKLKLIVVRDQHTGEYHWYMWMIHDDTIDGMNAEGFAQIAEGTVHEFEVGHSVLRDLKVMPV
jgi:hypothetical protein